MIVAIMHLYYCTQFSTVTTKNSSAVKAVQTEYSHL